MSIVSRVPGKSALGLALAAICLCALSCGGSRAQTRPPAVHPVTASPQPAPPPAAPPRVSIDEALERALAQYADEDAARQPSPASTDGAASADVPLDGSDGDPAAAFDASLDEQYLQAILDRARDSAADQVQKRITYPDDLYGGAIVRSSENPGLVTVYYPLRSVGPGIGVKVTGSSTKDGYTVVPEGAGKPLVDMLMEYLKNYLNEGTESVTWYANRNMLEIKVLEENLPFVRDILEFLDTPPQQIMIEAAVWEVRDVQDTQLGARVNVARREGGGSFFNFFNSRLDAQNFLESLTSGQPFQGGVLDFVTAADANHARMNLVLQFLKTRGYADLVSQPRMRVTVGQTARIFTVEEIPFYESKLISTRLELFTKYRNVGVQLFVTPLIVGQDTITLAVLPVVSEVTGYTPPGPDGVINPIIASREAQTLVTVANKDLVTIGGLDQSKKVVTETKIPFLGDIPLLGNLFRTKRESTKKIQLWFTVQPTIAGDQSRIVVPELTGMPPVE